MFKSQSYLLDTSYSLFIAHLLPRSLCMGYSSSHKLLLCIKIYIKLLMSRTGNCLIFAQMLVTQAGCSALIALCVCVFVGFCFDFACFFFETLDHGLFQFWLEKDITITEILFLLCYIFFLPTGSSTIPAWNGNAHHPGKWNYPGGHCQLPLLQS